MNNKNAVRGAIITEFINSKDKNMKFSSVQELIKEGNVGDFYFKYKRKEESENIHTANRIMKLDLYKKEIITVDRNVYKILNQYGEIRAK
ncbi:MAG: hypothetical protein J6A15_05995 [Clostridia bacterium]|nr:hypothetical protein [Clostridia bacterium]